MLHTPTSKPGVLTIPTIHVDDVEAVPTHPIVLAGFAPAFPCTTIDELFDAVRNPVVRGCREGAVYDYVERPSAEVASQFQRGALDFNVTDSYVDEAADPDDRLSIPALIDAGNLLNRVDETKYFRKCLVVTQRGAFTSAHADPGGMAGWMYLFRGRKTWNFWDAVYAPLMYDIAREVHYDGVCRTHAEPAYQAIVDALPMWEGTLGAGELMYFPPGWVHRVWTHEDSFGYGGMSLHGEQLAQSVGIFLRDKRLAINDQFDYPAFLEGLTQQGYDCGSHLATIHDTFSIWNQNR